MSADSREQQLRSLTAENRKQAAPALEERLVELRLELGQSLRENAQGVPFAPPVGNGRFQGEQGLPEISRTELDAGTLAEGILQHGALIVRGLYDSRQLQRLELVSRVEETAICPVGDQLGCSAHTLFELMEIYRECGLLQAVERYHGGRTLVFGERAKLRRQLRERDRYASIPWHQDAAFFGRKCFAVNCWAAVTPCGADNPGLSVLPRRVDAMLGWDEAQGHAPLDYGRSIATAEFEQVLAACPPADCVLAPGDAVLFDEMTVHQTLPRRWKRDDQLVTITWFFNPGRFPGWGTPVAA